MDTDASDEPAGSEAGRPSAPFEDDELGEEVLVVLDGDRLHLGFENGNSVEALRDSSG